MKLSFQVDELHPLIPSILKKDNKNAERMYAEHLNKPFYFRNIMEKKQMLAEGKLSPSQFEDDGILRYEVNTPGRLNWEDQSYKLADKLIKAVSQLQPL